MFFGVPVNSVYLPSDTIAGVIQHRSWLVTTGALPETCKKNAGRGLGQEGEPTQGDKP